MNETNHPSSLATCTLIQDLLGVTDGGIYEAVVNLKQRLDAVVAECADMKNAHAAVLEHISVTDKGPAGTAAMIANDALYNTETPTVTAALAEVEMRGVEKFADAFEAETAKIMEGPFFYGQIERREAFSKYVRGYLVELREGRV